MALVARWRRGHSRLAMRTAAVVFASGAGWLQYHGAWNDVLLVSPSDHWAPEVLKFWAHYGASPAGMDHPGSLRRDVLGILLRLKKIFLSASFIIRSLGTWRTRNSPALELDTRQIFS